MLGGKIMLGANSRMPVSTTMHETHKTTISLKDVMSVIDSRVKKLKKNQTLYSVIIASLKSFVDKYIEEEKLKLSIEHTHRLSKINQNIRCRIADKVELEKQLLLVETELSNLKQDYNLLEKLYKEYNLLSKDNGYIDKED